MKGGFVDQRLSRVDIYSPLADLAKAPKSGLWQGTRLVGFQPQAMDQATPCFRSSSATRLLPVLAARRCSNVSKVMPIRGASEQPTYRLAHMTPTYAVRPRTPSLRRGFGCRCGACDVGYYGLLGRCYECGNRIFVLFLSRAVPALTILAITAIFFWGGNVES